MQTDNTVKLSSESLEEAAKKLYPASAGVNRFYERKAFEAGGNWQKEQYADLIKSHSELLEALNKLDNSAMLFADNHKYYYDKGNQDKIDEMLACVHNAHLQSKEAIEKATSIINSKK